MNNTFVTDQTVFVVDDDDAVCDALAMLLRAAGLRVETFTSAPAFLKQLRPEQSGCLILDIRMPTMSGLELQDALHKRRCKLPIIFLTGHGDIPLAVRALKKGAVDFIEKPHDEHRLLLATCNALRTQTGSLGDTPAEPHRTTHLEERLALLSAREREVLACVLKGRQTRTIAEELCVTVKTVEFHRGRIREKLSVASLGELFRLFGNFQPALSAGTASVIDEPRLNSNQNYNLIKK
ncbi:MAG TPA: response regulator [Accumulibacter sp.]|jgi:FixJ family two-component response regulator|nr:response regulator [Accumulibacter sp.]HQC81018.1 response regulator [Accumulibacter sp.]